MDEGSLTQSTFLKIKKATAAVLNMDEARITMDSRFVEDLGAESLDVITLIMQFEDEFKEKIPDEEIENLKAVKDVVAHITKKISERERT